MRLQMRAHAGILAAADSGIWTALSYQSCMAMQGTEATEKWLGNLRHAKMNS